MRNRLILVLLAIGLSACQTMQGQRETHEPKAPTQTQPLPTLPPIPEPRPVPEAVTPAPAPLPNYPKTAEQISGVPVTSLMKQARSYLNAKQPDKAAGVLERALRIEPRNYFVWSMLGQSYLAQKNYAQAESMALRSNALARGNIYVAIENWRTIAEARQARGDADGALQASAQIAAMQEQLAGAP